MKDVYFEIVNQVERLHKAFLSIVSRELQKMNIVEINDIQALILYNLGHSTLTISELTDRGYYLGSNISYNVRKLVVNGYLTQRMSEHDRRSSFISASDRGIEVYKKLDEIFQKHAKHISENLLKEGSLGELSSDLKKIEVFWKDSLYR
jgi:DNA-binding MarR family transcriptional regulator